VSPAVDLPMVRWIRYVDVAVYFVLSNDTICLH